MTAAEAFPIALVSPETRFSLWCAAKRTILDSQVCWPRIQIHSSRCQCFDCTYSPNALSPGAAVFLVYHTLYLQAHFFNSHLPIVYQTEKVSRLQERRGSRRLFGLIWFLCLVALRFVCVYQKKLVDHQPSGSCQTVRHCKRASTPLLVFIPRDLC